MRVFWNFKIRVESTTLALTREIKKEIKKRLEESPHIHAMSIEEVV